MSNPRSYDPVPLSQIQRATQRLREMTVEPGLFTEQIVYFSQGDMSKPQYYGADVSWSDESGDNSVRGDGRTTLNQGRGKRTRSTCTVEITSSLVISENGKDLFKVTDPSGTEVLLTLHRRDGIDEATQTLVCIVAREYFAQPGKRDG